jgi:hypothetical protein
MPSFNLAALDAATDGVPVGAGSFSVNVSGTFVGVVLFERRTRPDAGWQPIAKDNNGTPLTFSAPSGDLGGTGTVQEPDAQIRARMTSYASGTAVVRIGQ